MTSSTLPARTARPSRRSSPARRRRGSVVGPSLVAGVLMALSIPPWGWWPLAFVGGALFWWRLGGLAPRTRLLAGWALGLGLFFPGLWWATSFNVYGGIVLILVEALAPGVGALITPGRAGRMVALPGAMVLGEAIRAHWPFGGLPMGSIALGQAASPLLFTARIGGPLLVIGTTWLVGLAVGAIVVGIWDRWGKTTARAQSVGSRQRPASLASGLAGAVVAVAVVVAGTLAPAGGPTTAMVRVAAVQGGGRRGFSQTQVPPSEVFAAQVAAEAEIPAQDGGRAPTLVIWPEDVVALPGPLRDSPDKAIVAGLARQLHTTMIVGVTEDVGATKFRNEAVTFSPTGRVLGSYEKVHRVPFGEYIPYRSFFSHLANLSAVPRDAIPGHGDGVLRTPSVTVGTMISFEVFFPDRGRDPVVHGADLLAVPTNTSSYRTSQVPTQEVAADRLQAVTEGRYLVQAAPTGYSDIVSPSGTVLARSVLGRRQVLFGEVGLRHGLTVFARTGELPDLIAGALCVAAGWLLAWRSRRRRDHQTGW